MNAFVTAALVIAAAVGSSGAAAQYLWQAREAAQASPAASRAAPTLAVQGTGAGLMIFIDPVTGQIRPPEQEDLQTLARQPVEARFTSVPQLFAGRDGSLGARLDPSFDSYMLASKRAGGGLDMECVPGTALTAAALPQSSNAVGTIQKKSTLDEK